MTLSDYLKKPGSRKILLVVIDPDGAPVYLSTEPYDTEPGDTPSNQPFAPVIQPGGLPRMARAIQALFDGESRAATTWAPLALASHEAGGVDLAAADLTGKPVAVYLTGPRADVAYADRAQLLGGVIGGSSGDVDGGLTFHLIGQSVRLDQLQVPAARFNAASEGAGFPAENDGQPRPLALGRVLNVTPVLVDAANHIYEVNNGPVNAIPAVYDNGFGVSKTDDLVNGRFTLTAAPAGVVTADVDGQQDGAAWLSSTADLVEWLAVDQGGLDAAAIDITGLPTETVGIYLVEPEPIAAVISRLLSGVGAWWSFTRAGKLKARLFEAPAAGGASFGETQQLRARALSWENAPELYVGLPVIYRRNWTVIDQPAGAVTQNHKAWLAGEGLEDSRDAASPHAAGIEGPRWETFFHDAAPAQAAADRALVLFSQVRKRVQVTLPALAAPLELGALVNLADAGPLDGDWRVVGIEEEWDAGLPLNHVELWG